MLLLPLGLAPEDKARWKLFFTENRRGVTPFGGPGAFEKHAKRLLRFAALLLENRPAIPDKQGEKAMSTHSEKKAGVALVLVSAMNFLSATMLTIVGVSLPEVGRELAASAVQLGYVMQVYVLGAGMFILVFGRWGDLVKQGKLCSWGLLLFGLITGGIGFAPNMETILVLRFLQGAAVSLFLSGSLALIPLLYPPEVRGAKMGIVSLFIYAGLSIGPVIGGLITTGIGWRYIYFLFTPVTLAAACASFKYIYDVGNSAPGERMDWRGSFLYAVAIALVTIGSTRVDKGVAGIACIVAGVLMLGAFLFSERNVRFPLLDVREFFSNRVFLWSSIAAMGNYASIFGMTFFLCLYLQYISGFSAGETGLIMLLQPIVQVIVSPVVGRLSDRYNPGKIATVGVLSTTIGLVLACFAINASTPLWQTAIILILIGFGYGVFITPNVVLLLGSVPTAQKGMASAMIGTMRTLGMIISMAATTIILALFMQGQEVNAQTADAFLQCMRYGMIAFAIFAFLGIASSIKRV